MPIHGVITERIFHKCQMKVVSVRLAERHTSAVATGGSHPALIIEYRCDYSWVENRSDGRAFKWKCGEGDMAIRSDLDLSYQASYPNAPR